MAIIATKAYSVEFENGERSMMRFTLQDSGAFKYGNQTEVLLDIESRHGKSGEYFDTRYDISIRRDGSNFDEWCRKVIEGNYMPTKSIEEI